MTNAPTTVGPLNFSRSAESDAHFACFDDNGYLAAPMGEL
jgi:hypothetical protein